MNPGGWALRHPVPVAVVTAGAVLFGILSLLSLNREFIPPMMMPSATVVSLWPGVAAGEVDRDVTQVLLDEFATVSGLTDMDSESREGVSLITLRFTEGTDNDAILQELRNRVDRASADLPEGLTGEPRVSTWGSVDLPVFSFSVSAPWEPDRIARYTEDVLLPELYRVDGMAEAIVIGDRRKELVVRMDPAAAGAAGVTPVDVYGAIGGRNLSIPSGLVEWAGSQWAMGVSGEFRSVEELSRIAVGNAGRRSVLLSDIAEIGIEYGKTDEMVRSGGGNLIVVQITKRESGHTIRMSREIRSRLAGLEDAGDPVSFSILHDDSVTIRTSLAAVMRSAAAGIAMAIAVLWLFLRNGRYTLIIAVSLPVSLVLAFAGMRLAGQSVNVLTLAGITVSLGMIVDASIVVLENIHSRYSGGDEGMQAALNGVGSVSGAVTASATTSVSVFVPMLFLRGIIGNVMKDLSITIVLCLTASLFAALMIVPLLAGRVLNRKSGIESLRAGGTGGGGRFTEFLEKGYRTALEKSLGMSRIVMLTAAVILLLSVLSTGMMGVSFIPAADYDELFISLELEPGSTLDECAAAADRAEAVIREAIPELDGVVFYVGMADDLTGEGRSRESAWGHVLLTPSRTRASDFRDLIRRLNTVLPGSLPGVRVTVFNGGFDRMLTIGTEGAGYRVELTSESPNDLRKAADRVENLLASDSEIIGTSRNVTEDRLSVTAELAADDMDRLGISSYDAALTSRIVFGGSDAGEFRPAGYPDRTIRLTSIFEGTPPDASALMAVPVRTAAGSLASLGAVMETKSEISVSGIRRSDRARALTVVGYPSVENIRGITDRLQTSLAEHPLPDGVEWERKGVAGLITEAAADLALVLLVSLFLVYAVMAIQFERLVQPLIIMISVPFSFIGVVMGLAIFGSDLSIISFLGIIALGGIVVNNAIIQVDRMNRLRRAGMTLDDAVVTGAVTRLRPILMTTLTTFMGVLPLSLARGAGARIYAPLGQAIAGGLVTSTLVTLFLVPSLYRMVEERRLRQGLVRNGDEVRSGDEVA